MVLEKTEVAPKKSEVQEKKEANLKKTEVCRKKIDTFVHNLRIILCIILTQCHVTGGGGGSKGGSGYGSGVGGWKG